MWKKEQDPYFSFQEFLDFHLSTAHSDSNMSANGVKRVYEPKKEELPLGNRITLDELTVVDEEQEWFLKGIFKKRRTSWEFDKKLTVNKLSLVLKAALGITSESWYGPHKVLKKAYASAGGEYSINIYMYLQNFADSKLNGKVMRYLPEEESFFQVKEMEPELINKICSTSKYTSNQFKQANCLFFFTTSFKSLFSKYGRLTYRLSFLEAGHICQNLQIVSSLLDVSSVPLGGFYDEDIRSMLDLEQEYCLYALAMG